MPLIGFFLLAFNVDPDHFLYLAISLLISLGILIPLRSWQAKKNAEVQLKIQNFEEQENLVDAETHQEKLAIKAFRKKIVNYSQLKVLTERLSQCLYLDDTSKTLSSEVNRLFGDEETTIILYLFHSRTGELGLSASQKGQLRINIKSKKGDIFDQWLVRTMQPLLIEDIKTDYRFDSEKIDNVDLRPIRSLISVPLMVGNKALGILRIDSPKEDHFTTEELRFLTTIGDLGAIAIENAQLFERVEQLAIKDGLTGLFLRRYLVERLPEELNRQLRMKAPLSLMMIDLDHFKDYNDKFGHVAGDIVLRTVGMLLLDFFKNPGELVCRYGGEEFCVVLPDKTKVEAKEMANQICKKIEAQTILLRREKTNITISVGVATFPEDGQMKNDLIQKADQALYKAKNNGRNQVVCAD